MRTLLKTTGYLSAGLLACGLLLAATAAAADAVSAPLANLPSAPGNHIAKIKALGDGEWLDLGEPTPDPKWGAAPGRAYTNKMAYAPDLVGGFLQGEGVHGAYGSGPRDGYYNDDVFFYDLMAHRYICLYPGTRLADLQVQRDEQGFIADKSGQNFPIAIAVHGYECLSYNPQTREFMTLQTGSPYSREIRSRLTEMVGESPLEGRKEGGKSPYFYSVESDRWFRRLVTGTGPQTHLTHALTFIPSINQTVQYQRGTDFWFYDHAKVAWEKKTATGGRPTTVDGRPSREGTLCYDSRRDRLYLFNRDCLTIPWAYDIQKNELIDLQAKNQFYPPSNSYEEGKIAIGSTASGAHYDSAADVVVMRLSIKQGTGDPRNIPATRLGLAVYDPAANAWEKDPIPLPEAAQRRGAWNSFYSPELNVHVFHIAGDSRTNGTVVVYRHRRK